ncbi:hypothetical protein CkaCkLH20_03362 [Colletotrichum karsti]|uniref:Peptidase S8/S53 domain-containing protein n=1 Tax=Colletotrichum karsti TaxID=1095194 RepID=A0A9P6IAW0_9PEZI|nr:uncharacterized protein CkaCkLH20_03362 [Colletotrichum karsti]KAF9879129.1 hypothetical protein CkaCkLH20_03362 [Colletotrichum karsti]
MTSKCWFVLSQTHYPPPIIPEHGLGSSSGPICLGHLIPDLRHLDNVINRNGPLETPPSMPIHPTKAWELKWQRETSSGVDLSATAGVPIAAAAGLTMKLDAGIAFQTTVSNYWEFESLDTFIIQPTNSYVEDSLEPTEVGDYLKGRGWTKSSTMFMITGIIVARGASFSASKSRSHDVHGGPGAEFPLIAEAGGQVVVSQGNNISSAAPKITDFVWAVRLAKISKGFIDRKWSFETFSSGATFGLNDKADIGQEVAEALKGEEDGEERITANLQLRQCCSRNEPPDAMDFRLFLLKHPHRHNQLCPPEWQDIQICIPRERRVGLKGKKKTAGKGADLPGGSSVVSSDTFCGFITQRFQSQLTLAVLSDGRVISRQQRPCLDDFMVHGSSVSLSELLKFFNDHLRLSHKILLSYIIAKSFWQFYDSDWMRHPWTKKDVHFMFESDPSRIYISEPFLSTQFSCNADDPDNGMHPFPKILALGIMFLEIGLGHGLEDHWRANNLDSNGQPNATTNFYTAQRVFNETREVDGYVVRLGQLIKRCINHTYFLKYKGDVEGLREAIQKDIVNVLYSCYQDFDKDPDDDKTGSIILPSHQMQASTTRDTFHRVSSPPSSELTRLQFHSESIYAPSREAGFAPMSWQRGPVMPTPSSATLMFQGQQGHAMMLPHMSCHVGTFTPPGHLPDGTMSRGTISSDDWFRHFEILRRVIRRPQPKDASYSPVKIAILDTGVSPGSGGFVTDYKDFVSNDHLHYQDRTGHGTEAVSLIRRVYENAEVYVGRIFKERNASENTIDLMTKAIYHAMSEWKADIIVLASGFECINPDLETAIKKARQAKILIFAAASNYGNITDIAFPARMYVFRMLFCMFSTTPDVRASQYLNPSPPKRPNNFAIIGEDIKFVNLPDVGRLRSGTSYSAMIGAAVAGLVLEFARHDDVRERDAQLAENLRTVEGMSAVFTAMARDTDNKYQCVAPWKILSEELRNDRVDKVVARRDVMERIITAWKGRYQ